MLHQPPQILEREQTPGAAFCFAIGVVVGAADAPRVSVKPASVGGGQVEIVSVEQVFDGSLPGCEEVSPAFQDANATVAESRRSMVFEAEAQRGAEPWLVMVVVECGPSLITLPGPLVPEFCASGPPLIPPSVQPSVQPTVQSCVDRFRGWVRPGPPIPVDDAQPADDETLDWLCGHFRIFQYATGHRFSADDVLCGWFASTHAPRVDRALDLGSGIGSVAMTVAWRLPGCAMATIEAQDISLRLALKSIAKNGLQERVTPYLGDLRDAAFVDDVVARHGPFDLVTGSPPYWPLGSALPAKHPQAVPARLEVRGDIADYARAAARALAPGGVFSCVFQASQDARVRAALDDAGLALLVVRFVRFKADASAAESGISLYCACRKVDVPRGFHGGREGKPVIEPDLVLRTADGRVHPEYATVRLQYGFPPGDADPDER